MNTKRLFLYHLVCKFLPPSKCHDLKTVILRWCGAKVGKNVEIMSTAKIYGELDLIIGDNVFIGHDALIMGPRESKIIIEDYAKVASRAIIVTGYHKFEPNGQCISGEGRCANIIIKKGSVISTGSIVYPGKIIGPMAYVSAGSVVTHDVPELTRVGGVPAREILKFPKESSIF